MTSDFGQARLKVEGAPIHPDEITYLCDCPKCKKRIVKQQEAYDKWLKEYERES